MTLRMSIGLRNARATLINTYAANGVLELRSGAQPASLAEADSGLLLCSVELSAAPFATATNGTITLQGIWTGVGLAAAGAGTSAGHFRMKTSTGSAFLDGSVSVPGGGGELIVDSLEIAQYQPIRVLALSYTDGNS